MSTPLDQVPPFGLFGGVSDEVWGWLHLEGREQCPFLGGYLPGLSGDPEFEARLVGVGGKEALDQGLEIYELFKHLNEKWSTKLAPSSRVLDFGCGWGRVIRFFLKDVAPENLIGIDLYESFLAVCTRTNRWCHFQHCETLPPSGLEASSFDLIYAFSVFSHLSQEAHERWLQEFRQLLKPSGVLILTTFRREMLASGEWSPVAERFVPVEQWLSAYDQGEFCYVPQEESTPHFGYTFIPEQYVRTHWSRHFVVREYFEAPTLFQSIIVCTQRE
jgi:SAM-dependent methyltransferase